MLKCAGRRKESRGLNYNVDFHERVESERIHTVLKCDKVDEEGETGAPGGPNAGEDVKLSFTSR